jgi:CSLREA domain-containing protein
LSRTYRPSGKPIGKTAGLASGLIVTLALIVGGTAARAATIKVDSIADDTDAAHCTLREAINSANGSAGMGTCTSGTGTDSITFSVTGTIVLRSQLPAIVGKLTITGPASPGITISGARHYRVMQVDDGATLNLDNLTIELGESSLFEGRGAGVLNSGTLTVTQSVFRNNSSDASDGGGAIYNTGAVTVTRSTFLKNTALGVFGGAINNLGTLTVTRSTFSGNMADGGAGISNTGGRLTVTNSTFSGNEAGIAGGGITSNGTLKVTACTFSGNEAGIAGGGIQGPASLKSTILAKDRGGGNCDGAITDAGYNISDDESCRFSATGSHNKTNPKLDTRGLQDNGGPTQTIALLAGSPAIDRIPVVDCTDQEVPPEKVSIDQRGVARPGAHPNCDIGAFETSPTPTATPTSTSKPTHSPTPTGTHTRTPTRTPTKTPTRTPTKTPAPTNTKTPTRTPTRTPTPKPTQTSKPTPTPKPTPTRK